MKYFGTNLEDHGHYLWELEEDKIFNRNLDFKVIPFNPEEMPRRAKGALRIKGDVEFYQENGYSILAIEGSCVDKRWGTKSVFFIKELLSKDKMINKIKSIPIANKIIKAMPFEIQWE